MPDRLSACDRQIIGKWLANNNENPLDYRDWLDVAQELMDSLDAAESRIAGLEARLEAVRAAVIRPHGIYGWRECRTCHALTSPEQTDETQHHHECWLATALGWERRGADE